MTNKEALNLLLKDGLSLTETEAEEFCEAYNRAISALAKIDHLKDRPCQACEFHKENGCCKWMCVFEED